MNVLSLECSISTPGINLKSPPLVLNIFNHCISFLTDAIDRSKIIKHSSSSSLIGKLPIEKISLEEHLTIISRIIFTVFYIV